MIPAPNAPDGSCTVNDQGVCSNACKWPMFLAEVGALLVLVEGTPYREAHDALLKLQERVSDAEHVPAGAWSALRRWKRTIPPK